MMYCKKCRVPMNHVLRFEEEGKSYEFNRCRNCGYESKKVPFSFEDKIFKKNLDKTNKQTRQHGTYRRRVIQ